MVDLYLMRELMRRTLKVQWKIEKEEAKATKTTTVITGMPHGGAGKDQVADGAIKISDIKEAYREVLDTLQRMRDELDPLLDSLENPDDRAVMRLRYIKGFSPEDIADAIHRTDRSIYYYLSRAEDQLARRFPEKVKK